MQHKSDAPGLDLSGDQLTEWALLLAGAMAIGVAIHLALRALGLTWVWALPMVALVPLVALVDPEAAVALAVACASAKRISSSPVISRNKARIAPLDSSSARRASGSLLALRPASSSGTRMVS